MSVILTNLAISPECACGGSSGRSCPPGALHGSWIGRGLLADKKAGLLFDPLTDRCIREVEAIEAALVPEKVIYEGLPEIYRAMEEQWHDVDKRSRLLSNMANASDSTFRSLLPPDRKPNDFILYWSARLKGYLEAISSIALDDVLPDAGPEKLDVYFTRRF